VDGKAFCQSLRQRDSEAVRQYERATPQGLNDHSRMMAPSHPITPCRTHELFRRTGSNGRTTSN
jgi:hypothetical protein